jgi:DNA-binding CsgD family transcriptional regulator
LPNSPIHPAASRLFALLPARGDNTLAARNAFGTTPINPPTSVGTAWSEPVNTAESAVYIQRLLRACEAEWGLLHPAQQTETIISLLPNPLTEREREVLACITAGLTNREIEEHLVISRNTVRTHLKNLYSKLGVNGRKEAIEQAQLLGLV